jgi:hypothetical protein
VSLDRDIQRAREGFWLAPTPEQRLAWLRVLDALLDMRTAKGGTGKDASSLKDVCAHQTTKPFTHASAPGTGVCRGQL